MPSLKQNANLYDTYGTPQTFILELAEDLGLRQACLISELERALGKPGTGIVINGTKWLYQSQLNVSKRFKFWSRTSIFRAYKKLTRENLIVGKLITSHSHHKKQTTKVYTINFRKVNRLFHKSNRTISLNSLMSHISDTGKKAPKSPVFQSETTGIYPYYNSLHKGKKSGFGNKKSPMFQFETANKPHFSQKSVSRPASISSTEMRRATWKKPRNQKTRMRKLSGSDTSVLLRVRGKREGVSQEGQFETERGSQIKHVKKMSPKASETLSHLESQPTSQAVSFSSSASDLGSAKHRPVLNSSARRTTRSSTEDSLYSDEAERQQSLDSTYSVQVQSSKESAWSRLNREEEQEQLSSIEALSSGLASLASLSASGSTTHGKYTPALRSNSSRIEHWIYGKASCMVAKHRRKFKSFVSSFNVQHPSFASQYPHVPYYYQGSAVTPEQEKSMVASSLASNISNATSLSASSANQSIAQRSRASERSSLASVWQHNNSVAASKYRDNPRAICRKSFDVQGNEIGYHYDGSHEILFSIDDSVNALDPGFNKRYGQSKSKGTSSKPSPREASANQQSRYISLSDFYMSNVNPMPTGREFYNIKRLEGRYPISLLIQLAKEGQAKHRRYLLSYIKKQAPLATRQNFAQSNTRNQKLTNQAIGKVRLFNLMTGNHAKTSGQTIITLKKLIQKGYYGIDFVRAIDDEVSRWKLKHPSDSFPNKPSLVFGRASKKNKSDFGKTFRRNVYDNGRCADKFFNDYSPNGEPIREPMPTILKRKREQKQNRHSR